MITVTDLYESFPMGGLSLTVLKGVDLQIQRGELIAIVGAREPERARCSILSGRLIVPPRVRPTSTVRICFTCRRVNGGISESACRVCLSISSPSSGVHCA